MLQKHVSELKQQNSLLSQNTDEVEQYGRRLCLRIEGVPTVKNEKPNDVFKKVENIIRDADVEIPNLMIDRAHRVGPKINKDDGSTEQGVIVRFVSFRHRTMLYYARKKLYKEKKISIRLDLTKREGTVY